MTVRDYRREKRHGELRGQVGYYLARSGYSKRELAVKLGMGNATLYNKLRNPDSFTVGELVMLLDIMGADEGTRLRMIA